MTSVTADYLYRYQSSLSGADKVYLHELKLPVVKQNTCSVWVDYFGKRKIVYDFATKKFAHETKEAALESWKIRRRFYIARLRRQLEDAELSLKLFTEGAYEILPPLEVSE